MNEDVFDFGRWLERLSSRWKLHLVNALVAGAVMGGLTFLMPSWYRSTAVLLPPEENDVLGATTPLARLLTRVPSITGGTMYYTPSDVFKTILTSRSVHERVIGRFGLQKVYGTRSMEKTLREFRQHARVTLAPDGTITVSVEDRSRDRAATLTNALVEELDRFNVERRNFQAKRARIFLENRVAGMDSLQQQAETLLREYQKKEHVVAPPEAESANLGPLADLMARKMALEVRLSLLRSYLNEDNEQVIQVKSELEQVKNQLAGLPQVVTELGRLMRDVKLYEQVYLLLSAQLEDARLREVMDTPTVTLLDRAVPSERRARPVRWLWAAGAGLAAVLASLIWVERSAAVARRPEPMRVA